MNHDSSSIRSAGLPLSYADVLAKEKQPQFEHCVAQPELVKVNAFNITLWFHECCGSIQCHSLLEHSSSKFQNAIFWRTLGAHPVYFFYCFLIKSLLLIFLYKKILKCLKKIYIFLLLKVIQNTCFYHFKNWSQSSSKKSIKEIIPSFSIEDKGSD